MRTDNDLVVDICNAVVEEAVDRAYKDGTSRDEAHEWIEHILREALRLAHDELGMVADDEFTAGDADDIISV